MKTIEIIGACIGIAAPHKGASLGPDAIRLAGLRERLARLGKKVIDAGNLPPLEEPFPATRFEAGVPRYLDKIHDFLILLKKKVHDAFANGQVPLILGGDHSCAIASMAASALYHADRGERPGLLWFDAHADLNTEATSSSGNVHGMPLAVALGRGSRKLTALFESRCFDPGRTAIFGVRSVDPREREIVADLGVTVFTMKDIDEMGARESVRKALRVACPENNPFHLSFDIDGIDSQFVPGTSTPVLGGITLREAYLFMELIAENGRMASMDMAEVNPLRDMGNRTSELAASLLESVFGKVIF